MTEFLQRIGLGSWCQAVDPAVTAANWEPLHQAEHVIRGALDILSEYGEIPLAERPVNFAAIETMCGEAEAILQQFGGRDAPQLSEEQKGFLSHIQTQLDEMHRKLTDESVKSVLIMQKKATSMGFGDLYHDPRALRFACKSNLIYTMQMFGNARDVLEGNDLGVQLTSDRKVMFKVEGRYITYDEVIERGIAYDPESGKFPGWSFVHPDGFVHVDSYDYDDVPPVARLSPQALRELQEHAQKFSGTFPEGGSKGPRDCVFQLVTSEDRHLQGSPLTRNLGDWFPMHASLRVITADGHVYSCGSRIRKEDEHFVPGNYFSTKVTKMPIPDYTETYPYEERRVTSYPITGEDAQTILNMLKRANQGVSFCFPRQNCTRVVTSAASLVGLNIDVRMPIREVLWNCLPNMNDIPVVGPLITQVATAVDRLVGPIFRWFSNAYTATVPLVVRKVLAFPMEAATAVMKKIATVFINLTTIAVGSMQAIPPDDTELRQRQIANVQHMPGLEWFEQLIHPRDIFRDDAIPVYHAKLLKDWQERQNTTVTYRKTQSELCVVPRQQ